MRNTREDPRAVVPVRLSEAERWRIYRAAEARGLPFSSYMRWAALEAASDQELRSKRKPVGPKREPTVIDLDPEPSGHWVDGEWVAGS